MCRNTDIIVEIRLDELKVLPAGLEEDVIEFHNLRARAKHIQQLPLVDQSKIYHQGEWFLIYCEEGYDYGKGVVLNMVKLLRCIITE